MGEVAKCEYESWAIYLENFGRLPKFNDIKKSQKYKKRNKNTFI
jgi:hypothetical protein